MVLFCGRAISATNSLDFDQLYVRWNHQNYQNDLRKHVKKKITWDQALFSFRFENYIPVGKAKRKESLIQTFNKMSAAHFFD